MKKSRVLTPEQAGMKYVLDIVIKVVQDEERKKHNEEIKQIKQELDAYKDILAKNNIAFLY